MAADNVVANAGSGGATFRAFSDGTNEWPASIVSYVTGGSAGAWTLQGVDATHGLPVAQQGSWSVAILAGSALMGGVQLVDSGGTNKVSISAAGALKVDGSAVTQPISATNLPLPAGAATSAKQPALGTAGTAATDVLTVQGIASMTPLKVDGSATTQPVSGTVTVQQATAGNLKVDLSGTAANATAIKVDGSAVTQPVSGSVTANAGSGTFGTQDAADGPVTPGTAAAKSLLIGAQFNTAAPTLTTGQQAALQADANGNLKVAIASGGGSGGTASSFNAAFPATGTAAGASDGTNMKPLLVDASGFLKVNVAAGGASGGTSSSFGSADPATGTAVGFSDGANMREARVFDADTGAGTQYVLGVNLRASGSGGSTELLGQQTMAASLPVAIASNQSAVPVSGTVTANIGTTNGVALDTSVNGILVSQGSTTSGEKGPLVQGAVTTAAPTYTTAQTSPLSLTTAGALRVDGSATTQPVSGSVTANQGGAPWTQNVTQLAGTAVDTNSGVKSAGTLRVVLATDQPQLTNALKVDGSAVTQPVSGTVTANVGTTNGLALDATLTGGSQKAIPVAATAGGATPYHLISAATTNATNVKASAGQIYAIQAFNLNTAPRFLKFYDKATAPTVGTDTPVKTIVLPGNTNGAGCVIQVPVGSIFTTGISFAITGGIADTDNTAIGANDCAINFDYK